MLSLKIPEIEFYNEKTKEFISSTEQTITLEHSLISLSKWESKWQKPFLTNKAIGNKEFADYINCMSMSGQLTDIQTSAILSKQDLIKKIQDYIDNPMTATTFREDKNAKPNREVITSELIYYWMIEYGIPFECQKWHLNRLLTLIRVCGVKGSSGKKMSKREIMEQNRALNAARRAKTGSKG